MVLLFPQIETNEVDMDTKRMDEIVAGIAENYQARELCFNCVDRHFPSRGQIIGLI